MHLQRLRVHDVAYYEAEAMLPLFASVDLTPAVTDLTTSIDSFNAHGQPQSIDAPGVGAIEFAFETVRNFATRLKSIGVPVEQLVTLFGYEVNPLAFGAMNTIGKVVGEVLKSDGAPVTATRDAQTPHRDRRLTVTADDEVVSRQIYSVDGQLWCSKMIARPILACGLSISSAINRRRGRDDVDGMDASANPSEIRENSVRRDA
jgi:hypothetical protein